MRPTPPNLSRLDLGNDLVLDARRVAWFPRERALVVADVHLGYAWVQRRRGQLLPLPSDDTLQRLAEVRQDYGAERLIFLGDLVHGVAPLPPLEAALRELAETLAGHCRLTLAAGNHDRRLDAFIAARRLPIEVRTAERLGPHLLVHGDLPVPAAEWNAWREARGSVGRVVMGHEHPAVTLRDGQARAAKCPCFLVANERLVLPAFSRWAAGSEVTRRAFMSPLAQGIAWEHVIPVLGLRLLAIPWSKVG